MRDASSAQRVDEGLTLTMKITMGYFIFMGCWFSFVNHANQFSIA